MLASARTLLHGAGATFADLGELLEARQLPPERAELAPDAPIYLETVAALRDQHSSLIPSSCRAWLDDFIKRLTIGREITIHDRRCVCDLRARLRLQNAG